MYKIETKKDRIKIVRALLELIAVIALIATAVKALSVNRKYQPYDRTDSMIVSGEDHGFIAVSYFGVDREGTSSLVSVKQLDEHLAALYECGYVTISQQDILDYYNNGTALPDKALFLMFEDGRRDTVLFAQKLLEKYNYKATILGYADKFEKNDPKFLSASDLTDLENSGYWELGTNGYRLSYINCYDRYDRFLGQMSSEEFVTVANCLNRDYNHYLMDYIRDEDRIPTESEHQMRARINTDYNLMETVYTEKLGKMPQLYCLMHSNTGRYGDTDKVSEANDANIKTLFAMNFNREGYALNTKDASVYDLTRIQPQPDWTVNHLLTRIKDDIDESNGEELRFVSGITTNDWKLISGAVEYKKDRLILTTETKANGMLILDEAEATDYHVTMRLQGLLTHTQSILLRADDTGTNGILVSLTEETLTVDEMVDGERIPLAQADLHELVPANQRVSIDEDRRDTLVKELNMRGRFANSSADSVIFYATAQKEKARMVSSVKDGAEEYKAAVNALEKQRDFEITLTGNTMDVRVNGTLVLEKVEVTSSDQGTVALISSWNGWNFGKRYVGDDVYDGIFKSLTIEGDGNVLYDNALHGGEKALDWLAQHFNGLVNWFIVNL